MQTFTHQGMVFSVVDAGPPEAGDENTVVLLHGFPQTSAAWDDVSSRLHPHGLRTLAPDTRGVSRGARPRRSQDYRVSQLVGDVNALLDAAELGSVHLVGHDWGGGIAWAFAMRHPQRVRSLTVLSTPHPGAMQWAMRHSDQALRSWYMLAMQLPVVPEVVLGQALRGPFLTSAGVSAERSDAYARTLLQRGGLRGALGPYRGMLARGKGTSSRAATSVTVPTTYVWGAHDAYLGRAAAEKTAEYVTADYRFVELDADHWLPEKHPDLVADEILARIGPGRD